MRIAISGAGIAGPTAAHWLRRAGHVPTLIESAPTLRSGGYVVDFWGLGYEIARRMGIEAAVRDAGYQVRTLRGVHPDGHALANVDVGAFQEAMAGHYTTVARSDLSRIIYSTVADDVEVIFGDGITAIDDHTDAVTVGFEHHSSREFDLVLGADGLHSRVRELVFGGPDPEHYLGCVVAAFTVAGYRPRDELTYVLYNVPGAHAGRFTLRDDRTLFLFVFRTPLPECLGDADAARALLRTRFADAGWECAPILARLDDAEDLYIDAVSQIRLPSWSRGRVALLGDAGAAVSLMAGEGTGLAMLEAYVLAGELVRARDDHREAFAAYERRLRGFVADKQAGALKFIRFFAAQTRPALALRNLGLRAMQIRPLAKLSASWAFRDNLELPDYTM